MAKRGQQESGEERVTAKSRPMMNLTARMPSVVSSSTSSNQGMTSYGYQDPGKSVVSDDRSGKPENSSPPGFFKRGLWSILVFSRVEGWSCGARSIRETEATSWDKLKKVEPHREEPLLGGNALFARYGETIHDGSGKLETVNHQEQAYSEDFVMGSDAAEFLNKVKDQVRNRMSNVAESGEEHSIIWGMFMATT